MGKHDKIRREYIELNAQGDALFAENKYEEALQVYLKAGNSFSAIPDNERTRADWRDISLCQNKVGIAYFELNDHQQAVVWYVKAVTSLEQISKHTSNYWRKLSNYQNNLGLSCSALNDHQQSLVWYREAVTSCEQIELPTLEDLRYLSKGQNNVAFILYRLKDHQQSLVWYTKAATTRKQIKECTSEDWRELAHYSNNIALINLCSFNPKQARKFYFEALDTWLLVENKSASDISSILVIYTHLKEICEEMSTEYNMYSFAQAVFSSAAVKNIAGKFANLHLTIMQQSSAQNIHLLHGLFLFLRLLNAECDQPSFPNQSIRKFLAKVNNRERLQQQLDEVKKAFESLQSLLGVIEGSTSLQVAMVNKSKEHDRALLLHEDRIKQLEQANLWQQQQNRELEQIVLVQQQTIRDLVQKLEETSVYQSRLPLFNSAKTDGVERVEPDRKNVCSQMLS